MFDVGIVQQQTSRKSVSTAVHSLRATGHLSGFAAAPALNKVAASSILLFLEAKVAARYLYKLISDLRGNILGQLPNLGVEAKTCDCLLVYQAEADIQSCRV